MSFSRSFAGQCRAALLGLLVLASPCGARAESLTVARLFASPELSGEILRGARFSADGTLITYLKAAEGDARELQLWGYELATRTHKALLDRQAIGAVAGGAEPLLETDRRERQRSAAFTGIVDYALAPDSRAALVSVNGRWCLADLSAPAAALRPLAGPDEAVSDARLSPRGHYVSFIRDHNLIVRELASGRETAITRDGAGPISYGTAEFIAQEEMDRRSGYWWSADERRLVFTRVDESRVSSTSLPAGADPRATVRRYPFAGTANASVALYAVALADPSRPVRIDLGSESEVYLARVQFLPGGQRIAVQRQRRDQKRLDLLFADVATGRSRVILTETSRSWVNLNDELQFLPARQAFLWASERSGYRHLYLYGLDGRLRRTLTQGPFMVVGDRGAAAVRGVDEARGYVYFMANRDAVTERQLYRVPLDRGGAPQRLTSEAGWHSVLMSRDGRSFLDTYSDASTPPSVTLRGCDDGRILQSVAANALAPGHPYYPYLGEHRAPRFGTIAASDGQPLAYALTTPVLEPGRRYPVVVEVYGGPGAQNAANRWGGEWPLFRQILARAGFVVFTLDNRGTGGRGVRFESPLYHHLASAELEDQLRGVAFLRTLPYVDAQRIGIFGWSYGGYLALQGVLRAPSDFAAAVAGAPVTDWRRYDTHYTERYLGLPQDNAAAYRAASVLTYAPTLQRPLLLLHGEADDNVLFEHTQHLMQALADAHRPFESALYPDGKHGLITRPDLGPAALTRMLEFLQRTLASAPP